MDSEDEMMVHLFMEEESNSSADEEEHFLILTALPQLQADENTASQRGGLKCGIKKSKPRQRNEGS
jgi:hypothetical protein